MNGTYAWIINDDASNYISELQKADSIIQEAFTCYERGYNTSVRAKTVCGANRKAAGKSRVIYAVIVIFSFIVTVDVSVISGRDGGFFWLLMFVVDAAVLYAMRNQVIFGNARAKEEYDRAMSDSRRDMENSMTILRSHEEELYILPPRYRAPECSDLILRMVKEGRAATLKEAFSMCDAEIRWRNMSYDNDTVSRQQQEIMRQQAQMQQQINRLRWDSMFR